MGIVLASNFDVKTGLSLDSRYNADTISDRNSIPVGIRYDGMQCYVKEDESLYILSGNDLSDNNNWIKSPYAKDYMPISGGTFTGEINWDVGDPEDVGLSISSSGISSYNHNLNNEFNDPGGADGSYLTIKDGSLIVKDRYGDFTSSISGAGIRLCELGYPSNDISYGTVAIGYNNFIRGDTKLVVGAFNKLYGIDNSVGSIAMGRGLQSSILPDNEYPLGIYQLFGQYNQIIDRYEDPEGTYDQEDNKNIFIIGVGTSDTDRKNGLVLYPTGNLDILGDIKLFAGTTNEIPSLKNYIDNMVISANGLRYKGNLAPTSTTPGRLTPAGSVGDMYLSTGSGYINGVKVESGDMIICCTDTAAATSSTYTTIKNNWNIIQANVDVMKGATSTAAGQAGLVPMPEATTETQFLSNAGTWKGITTNNISHGDSETLNSWISETETNIGDLTTLTTTNKNSLVEAVNEANKYVPYHAQLELCAVTSGTSLYEIDVDSVINSVSIIVNTNNDVLDQNDKLRIKVGNDNIGTYENLSMQGTYVYYEKKSLNYGGKLSATVETTKDYFDIIIELEVVPIQ